MQGGDTLLPALHATDTPNEGADTPEEVSFDLAEVYRDGDSGGDGNGSAKGAPPRHASAATVSHRTSSSSKSGRNALGEEDEDWETADDRIGVSLRGGVSLTSLDISSPRITAGFVIR